MTLRAGMLPWGVGPAESGGTGQFGGAQHSIPPLPQAEGLRFGGAAALGHQETHLESNGKPRDRCQSDKALCSAVICFPVVLQR